MLKVQKYSEVLLRQARIFFALAYRGGSRNFEKGGGGGHS